MRTGCASARRTSSAQGRHLRCDWRRTSVGAPTPAGAGRDAGSDGPANRARAWIRYLAASLHVLLQAYARLRSGADAGSGLPRYREAVLLSRTHERLHRIPAAAIDAGIAAAVALRITIAIAAQQESEAKDAHALAYLFGIAIAVPLLVRRRWPLAVFLASTLLVIAYHALHYPEIRSAAPLAVALYTAARAGHLRAVLVVVAGFALGGLAWLTLGKGESLGSALGTQRLVELLLVV